MIDTHCHLSKDDYDDIDLVIKENKEAGVSKMIVSACDKKSMLEIISLKDKYDFLYVTMGYHPSEALSVIDKDLQDLKKNLKLSKVVGVGEIGLDYYYSKEFIEKQKWLFEEQLKIAQELDMPVVIHSRDATLDTINILKKYSVRGIIHCFSGSLETANIYIKMGFYLGIGGVLTFKNSKLKEIIKSLSLDNIVLETDSPYLTPVPYRGKKNSSKYLKYVVLELASIKEMDPKDVIEITTRNANSLFDFNNK